MIWRLIKKNVRRTNRILSLKICMQSKRWEPNDSDKLITNTLKDLNSIGISISHIYGLICVGIIRGATKCVSLLSYSKSFPLVFTRISKMSKARNLQPTKSRHHRKTQLEILHWDLNCLTVNSFNILYERKAISDSNKFWWDFIV